MVYVLVSLAKRQFFPTYNTPTKHKPQYILPRVPRANSCCYNSPKLPPCCGRVHPTPLSRMGQTPCCCSTPQLAHAGLASLPHHWVPTPPRLLPPPPKPPPHYAVGIYSSASHLDFSLCACVPNDTLVSHLRILLIFPPCHQYLLLLGFGITSITAMDAHLEALLTSTSSTGLISGRAGSRGGAVSAMARGPWSRGAQDHICN